MGNHVIQTSFWELLNYDELNTGKLVDHISKLFVEIYESSLFVQMDDKDIPEDYPEKGSCSHVMYVSDMKSELNIGNQYGIKDTYRT